MSSVRVLDSVASSILSAVRMLSSIAKVLCRPSEYSIFQKQALCRPSRCSIPPKYDQSWPRMVILRSEEILCRPSKYSILQKRASYRPSRCFFQLRKYSDGRYDASSVRANTLSIVRVLNLLASSILSPVSMLPPLAQTFYA